MNPNQPSDSHTATGTRAAGPWASAGAERDRGIRRRRDIPLQKDAREASRRQWSVGAVVDCQAPSPGGRDHVGETIADERRPDSSRMMRIPGQALGPGDGGSTR